MATSFSSLPLDVFYDCLFPHLDLQSILALASTSHYFHELILSSETADHFIWKKRLAKDFHFPVNNTARTHGWTGLYRRVRRPRVYVWGDAGNDRLGLTSLSTHIRSVPQPARLHLDGITIVDLVAGGWSFHALDSKGQVHFWGTLRGDGIAYGRLGSSTLLSPFRSIREPTLLTAKLGRNGVSNLGAGRSHIIAKGDYDEVWEWHCWGQIARLDLSRVLEADRTFPFQSSDPPPSTSSYLTHSSLGNQESSSKPSSLSHGVGVAQISAGWGFSALLSKMGHVWVWWETRIKPSDQSVSTDETHPLSKHDVSSDSTKVYEVDVNMLRMPDIPRVDSSPQKIVKIASGDNFIVALTDNSRIYKLDISPPPIEGPLDDEDNDFGLDPALRASLENALSNGSRSWQHLRRFCEPGLPKITHISAHFQHFVAYNPDAQVVVDAQGQLVGEREGSAAEDKENRNGKGMVLMGRIAFDENSAPDVMGDLQGRGVIKVVMGDYHFGALTLDGRLLTWGRYSSGALGHGTRNVRLQDQMRTENGNGRFVVGPPPLDHPQRVWFSENKRIIEENQDTDFVFNAAFSGWHSSALVVSLTDADEERRRRDELDDDPGRYIPGSFPQQTVPRFGLAAAGRV